MSAVDAENAAAPTTAMVSKPHRLLERAAAVLRWQWPFATMVTFNWWTGNEDQIFAPRWNGHATPWRRA